MALLRIILTAAMTLLFLSLTPQFSNAFDCTMKHACKCNSGNFEIQCNGKTPPGGGCQNCAFSCNRAEPAFCGSYCGGCCLQTIQQNGSSSQTCSSVACQGMDCSSQCAKNSKEDRTKVASSDDSRSNALLLTKPALSALFADREEDSPQSSMPEDGELLDSALAVQSPATVGTRSLGAIRLVNASYRQTGRLIGRFNYEITNQGADPVVTSVVRFTVTASDGQSTPVDVSTESLIGGAYFSPGTSSTNHGLSSYVKSDMKIKEVRADLVYIEYLDGRVFGRDARSRKASWNERRAKEINGYREIARSMEGRNADERTNIIKSMLLNPALIQDSGTKQALVGLRAGFDKHGLKFVEEALDRVLKIDLDR